MTVGQLVWGVEFPQYSSKEESSVQWRLLSSPHRHGDWALIVTPGSILGTAPFRRHEWAGEPWPCTKGVGERHRRMLLWRSASHLCKRGLQMSEAGGKAVFRKLCMATGLCEQGATSWKLREQDHAPSESSRNGPSCHFFLHVRLSI